MDGSLRSRGADLTPGTFDYKKEVRDLKRSIRLALVLVAVDLGETGYSGIKIGLPTQALLGDHIDLYCDRSRPSRTLLRTQKLALAIMVSGTREGHERVTESNDNFEYITIMQQEKVLARRIAMPRSYGGPYEAESKPTDTRCGQRCTPPAQLPSGLLRVRSGLRSSRTPTVWPLPPGCSCWE